MNWKNVSKLYKYVPFSGHSISILINKKIWCPSPSSLNDPFDCLMVEYGSDIASFEMTMQREFDSAHKGTTYSQKWEDDLRGIFRKAYSRFSDKDREFYDTLRKEAAEHQAAINRFGILSLSATARSILMWSHYARNHTGFCIEFRRDIRNLLGAEAVPVSYVRSRTSNGDNEQEEDIFSRKYAGWSYEKEWRLIRHPGNALHPIPGEISSVILGARMDNGDIETIKNIVLLNNKEKNHCYIKIKYAKMDSVKYKINIFA